MEHVDSLGEPVQESAEPKAEPGQEPAEVLGEAGQEPAEVLRELGQELAGEAGKELLSVLLAAPKWFDVPDPEKTMQLMQPLKIYAMRRSPQAFLDMNVGPAGHGSC